MRNVHLRNMFDLSCGSRPTLPLLALAGAAAVCGIVGGSSASLGRGKAMRGGPATRPQHGFPRARMRYLENRHVRVGINLALGGAITWVSTSNHGKNLINHVDFGREVQMSDYSGPVPYIPPGKRIQPAWRGLGWNPVQAGDAFRTPSRTLSFVRHGGAMTVRCIPMIWPLKNTPARCTFQSQIRLKGNAILVRCRVTLSRHDKKQYPARPQECPAVYTVGRLWRLVSYTGSKPFTHGRLHWLDPRGLLARKQPVFSGKRQGDPWIPFRPTENWMALVNNKGTGLGIYAPGFYKASGGFYGAHPGHGGPRGPQTGYMAPNALEILDHNIVYNYHYALVPGSVKQIRAWVYQHARRPKPPLWTFAKDRQHWTYRGATDTGWPIKGCLDVSLSGPHPQLVSPDRLWQAAQAPTLYVDAAFKTQQKTATVRWRGFHDKTFTAARSAAFRVSSDGKYHRYAISLKHNKNYRGAMMQLRLDPARAGKAGAWMKVRSIGFTLGQTRPPPPQP